MEISEEIKEIPVNLVTPMYIYSDGPLPADYRCSLYSHRRQSAILVITSQLLRFCFTEHNLICDCRDSLQTWKLLNLQKANHSTKNIGNSGRKVE